jgi:pyochelin synthetase
MSTHEIVARLRELGVELWTEDGQLRFRAPRGVLTEEHKQALKANKAEIIELLAQPEVKPDPENRHEPFPLTDVQTAYLLGRNNEFGYGGVGCHGYLEVEMPGVDARRIEDAWNQLIERHDMLRAIVERDGYQHVLPEVPRLEVRETDAETARAEMAHRTYETDQWPLHDLRVLLTELDALLNGEPLEPLDITFRDYLLAERGLRDTSRYRRDREYWLERIDTLPAAPDLPTRETAGPARFRRLSTTLRDWDEFTSRTTWHGVTASSAVLAAYAAVLRKWSRKSEFSLT